MAISWPHDNTDPCRSVALYRTPYLTACRVMIVRHQRWLWTDCKKTMDTGGRSFTGPQTG